MGQLIPVMTKEINPGDIIKIRTEAMVKFAPMISPIMHDINVYFHYFFVPNRLLWSNWENFITGGPDGTLTPSMPQFFAGDVSGSNFRRGSLLDYLGVPSEARENTAAEIPVNALPLRAYHAIYNDYYRDENLMDEVDIMKDRDGYFDASEQEYQHLFQLHNRCWEKDYFTSALPWTQRGGEVLLPLGAGDVTLKRNLSQDSRQYLKNLRGDMAYGPVSGSNISGNTLAANDGTKNQQVVIDPNGTLEATVSAPTINDLRRANKVQEWLEISARGGNRYIEQIKAFFGVTSSDARLQRVEFLGGTKTPVMIGEVDQTSESSTTPQATQAGKGLSVSGGKTIKKSFEEHGIFMVIMSVMPRSAYFQGLPRMYSRFDKFDYLWPQFSNLGEQPVYNKEVYAKHSDPDGVFGYQSRYCEYKFMNNEVHGDFATERLWHWHMARNFSNSPNLNGSFVLCNPTDRIWAVTDQTYQHLWCNIYHDCSILTQLSKYGTPSL